MTGTAATSDDLDFEACYRAVSSRDRRFDGRFITGVLSTGIFCRPSCPARTPRRDRVRFFPSTAAALDAGFRACRRCRPELAPDIADAGGALAARALRLIDDGQADEGAAALATRLHVSERHLTRLLTDRFGAGPAALARMRRARVARMLVDQTTLPMSQIAFRAGFGSVRQFNATFREVYGMSPSELSRPSAGASGAGGGLVLRVDVPQPFDAGWVLRWLGLHGTPGADVLLTGGATSPTAPGLAPSVPPHGTIGGSLGVGRGTARSCPDGDDVVGWRRAGVADVVPVEGGLQVTALAPEPDVRQVIGLVRQVFDTDADIGAVTEALSADELLAPLVTATPGLRIPGSPDPWEGAIRTLLGQQVSARAAQTLMQRLADLHDGVGIPGPERLADLDLGPIIGLPRQRAAAIRGVARAVLDGLDLRSGADPAEAGRQLLDIPGIGPWTAQAIRLLTLRDPDAWPSGDVALRTAVGRLTGDRPTSRQLDELAERWRPWRGYAALWLWHLALSPDDPPTRSS